VLGAFTWNAPWPDHFYALSVFCGQRTLHLWLGVVQQP
jgi:hypothetical protein